MAKITSLLAQLKNNALFAKLTGVSFQRADGFSWQHASRTITYSPKHVNAIYYLLHECGHASLNHKDYHMDVELLTMERDAWFAAGQLAKKLHFSVPPRIVDDALDSYRDWLHARSICPHCGATGTQKAPRVYQCIACHNEWTVNEARTCALRRYRTKNRP